MEKHRIAGLPESMLYIPDFVSAPEEADILANIPDNRWISLKNRRLQTIPGPLSAENVLLSAPLPPWLRQPIVVRLAELGVFQDSPHGVNHCLVNEYLPGQGIMPHEDGAAYYPIVATVSLGGTCVLDVTGKLGPDDRKETVSYRIFQEPRSLLVTRGAAYTDTLHGIAEVKEDTNLSAATVSNWSLVREDTQDQIEAAGGTVPRTTRISLTFRDVQRVSSIGSRLFGKPRR